MEMDEYSVNEGDGVVEVCAQLMVAPADGLQCIIVATLTAMDGAKAGMSPSVCYSVGTILFGNSLFPVLMEDYSVSGTLEVTFMTGAMQNDTSCANITIIDDTSFESDHNFTVHVTSVELESGGTDPLLDIGMPAYATINIEDNDRESTLLQCCSSDISSIMFYCCPYELSL